MADVNRGGTPVIVVVAIIGLLSTVGASALGGYWASRSTEREFESRRTAEVEDLRRDVYIDFLRATNQACLAWAGDDEDKINSTVLAVIDHAALVHLLAGRELRDVEGQFASAILDGTACADNESYLEQVNAFVDTAQRELE